MKSSPTGADTNTDLTSTKGEAIWLEYGFTGLVWTCALVVAGILFWMSWEIFQEAQPAISKYGLKFLWSQTWDIGNLEFGALPFIYGTLVSSALALLLAVPTGLAVAIVTTEDFLPSWVRSPIGFLVELIAALPSVIVGLWGIFVVIPFLQPFQMWLFQNLGWIPLFKGNCFQAADAAGKMQETCGEPGGPGMFIAGIILAIMILPTIAAISREVLLAVPKDLRSASMALGGTRWETIWKILLPTGLSGILGAVILGLGRALGETMAVTMVIGNAAQITPSLLSAGYTIPSVLANQFSEAAEQLHIGALMYLSLILFVITLVVNIFAILLVQLIGNKGIKS